MSTPDYTHIVHAGHRDRRKVPPVMRRSWQVGEIQSNHHEIIRLIVLGYGNKEIAQMMNMRPDSIRTIRHSEVIQDKVQMMNGSRDAATMDLLKEIQDTAPKALSILKDVLDAGPDDGVSMGQKIKVAESLLDRAGFAPQKTVRAEHLHAHLTGDEIEAIKMRARNGSYNDTQKLSQHVVNDETGDIIDVEAS